ncbi:hypothetical protein C1I93_21410 [Micromonospora endophytica]|uniref:Uncharacterized protein n=1 Tax=Micromonospora endophytica TaxID=515350 RepID=A0A2W2C119_9ACTN|nr:hypothetical protein C1I93_21410 [Micromonospora endophytica]RIW49266.1 hypothetical protein D3H59_05825 [Micromonospora endophytica]
MRGSGEPPAAQPLPVTFPVPDPPRPKARRPTGAAEAPAGERQLVFFGAETGEPAVADLAGLLVGPGEVHRMGGTARLSLVVDAGWRVHVLVAELAQRGVRASWAPTEDQRYAVRTAYTRTLVPLAAAWLRGTTQHPPAGFPLDGRRLRLWLAAAGVADPPDFLLRLGGTDPVGWTVIGGALVAAGLGGELIEPGAGGPAYRIIGRRGTQRLAELVGERPSAAPPTAWPTRD